jgi:hypothetical protein
MISLITSAARPGELKAAMQTANVRSMNTRFMPFALSVQGIDMHAYRFP